jgi:hypothetical protein
MAPWFTIASFVLETLAMKLAGLDEDGLDLVFTIGKDFNVENARGPKAPEKFKNAMGFARPTVPTRPDWRAKTDMGSTLSKLFSNYTSRHQKKGMTLIVLTDGVWEGSSKEQGIETLIAEFCEKLKSTTMERRKFSIEFVRFGDNPQSMAKLKRLDDDLVKEYKIASVVISSFVAEPLLIFNI